MAQEAGGSGSRRADTLPLRPADATHPGFSIRGIEGRPGWEEVVLTGGISTDVAARLGARLEDAAAAGIRGIAVDATLLTQLDFAGVAAFIRYLQRSEPARARLSFFGLPAHVERVFEITRVRPLIDVQPSREATLHWLAGDRSPSWRDGDLETALRHLRVLARAVPIVADADGDSSLVRLSRAAFAEFAGVIGELGVPKGPGAREELERSARRAVERAGRDWSPRPAQQQVEQVTRLLVAEFTGMGPLNELLRDPTIAEIMVNGPRNVLIERDGRIERTDIVFRDDEHLTGAIRKIAERVGRRIDYANPTLDAFLEDGSRVHALLPPVSLDGPTLTIRRFGVARAQLEDLVARGALSADMAFFLAACVKTRLNVIIAGPGSSGKTTTMDALVSQVPATERLVTIEEVAEMDLSKAHSHLVRLQARNANVEGRGEITIRQLVREALRMRADRIVVGEARGAEMVEVLQAMRCGHDGSMTTMHASSPEDLIERAVTIALFANLGLSDQTLRRMVVDGVDVIAFLYRFPAGERRLMRISEPYRDARGEVAMNDVFAFAHEGYDTEGRVQGCFRFGARSRHDARFVRQGIEMPWDVFEGAKG